jgi:hypothetical protein
MQKGLLFWLLMLLWLVLGLWVTWPVGGGAYGPVGVNLLLFVLIALLGWKEFGPPLQG